MATATVTSSLNEITDCDTTTSGGTWAGVTLTVTTTDPTQIEGVACLGGIFKSTTDSQNDSFFTPSSSLNLSGKHLRWKLFTALKAVLKDQSLGGIDISLNDGSNLGYYHVSGGDKYVGGWETLVLDCDRTPDSGSQPTVSAITEIGIIFRLNAAAKNVTTCWFDWISEGPGIVAYGGSNGDEITFANIDTQDVYYGILEKVSGVFRVRGKLQIGDSVSTNNCYFKDTGKMIVFDDLLVSDTLYELIVAGNSTGTTVVDLSGNFISSETNPYSVDMTDDTYVTSILIDGTTFQKATAGINLSTVVSGNLVIFDGCGAIDPNGATLDGCTIKNSSVSGTSTGSLIINSSAEAAACDNMNFLNYTGSTTYAIYVDASVTSFSMDKWIFDDPNNTTSYALYWAGTGGTLTISALNGTNLVDAGCTSAGGTVSVVNSVTLQITVKRKDTKAVIQNAEVSIYRTSDDAVLLNEVTDALGVADASMNFTVDTDVYYRVREIPSADPQFLPESSEDTVTSAGLVRTVYLTLDPNIDDVSS